MMPGGNGLDLVKEIKSKNIKGGIIIISAKNTLDDRIVGLDLGSDDYLTKPFHLAELNARLKSIVRRRQFDGNTDIVFNEIRLIPENHEVFVNDSGGSRLPRSRSPQPQDAHRPRQHHRRDQQADDPVRPRRPQPGHQRAGADHAEVGDDVVRC